MLSWWGGLRASGPRIISFVFRVLTFILLSEDHDISSPTSDSIWLTWRFLMTSEIVVLFINLCVIIPRRPHTVCPSWYSFFRCYLSSVRSSTGVGPRTYPVRVVHGGLAAAGRQVPTLPTLVRWWHADIWLLSSISGIAAPGAGICVCWRGCTMDAE